jgi:hypothetical protein
MKGSKSYVVLSILAILSLGTREGLISEAHAQMVEQAETLETEFQYAAKVVCSVLRPHQDGSLARGTYRTLINIHNPTDRKITFADKVALAESVGATPGSFSVTPHKKVTLQPDGAVQLSCGDIAGFFCPIDGVCIDFAFLEGFLIIKSPVELDVVSVYTARPTEGEVNTLEVETVQPRKLREMVKVLPIEAKPEIKKHIEYPPRKNPGYGTGESKGKQLCGGIAGLPCPRGQFCIDDPCDDCDPAKGGADCSGICIDELKAK